MKKLIKVVAVLMIIILIGEIGFKLWSAKLWHLRMFL